MTRRVLFVDDMPDMGALIVDMLQFEGIEADWCASGAEASDRLRSGGYRALVTDLLLGGPVDGEVLADLARELVLPSLVVSGDSEAIERLRQQGVDAVLKPIDIPDLVDWLRRNAPGPAAAANG